MDSSVIKVEASAGSGKTFQLAKYFLLFLLNVEETPAEVFAVTFANKAADEMKKRVITFLKKTALSLFSDEEFKSVFEEFDGAYPGKAVKLLDYIFTNYGDLKISTIDSFLSDMLRKVSVRGGSSAGIRISTDFDAAVEYAFNVMLDNLTRYGDIVEELVESYIHLWENPNWSPKKSILGELSGMFSYYYSYGKEFFCESLDITAMKKIENAIFRDIRALLDGYGEFLKKTAVKVLTAVESNKKLNFKSKIFTGESDIFPKGKEVPGEAYELFNNIIRLHKAYAEKKIFSSYRAFVEFFNLMKRIVEDYSKEENIVFLQEINLRVKRTFEEGLLPEEALLYTAPYVKYFLFDEFQDTNPLNWDNMLEFVNEAVSSGGKLFYVGDKKQAIYRFRGGDRRLFDTVSSYYENMGYEVEKVTLSLNRRSRENIVNFVNDFFSERNLRSILSPLAEKYLDGDDNFVGDVIRDFSSKQSYMETKLGGSVEIIKAEDVPYSDRIDFFVGDAAKKIESCIERGYSYGDIAILSRENGDLENIGARLSELGIPVFSERYINVKENGTVSAFISFLKFLDSPIDNIAFVEFILSDLFLKAASLKYADIASFLFEIREFTRENRPVYLKFRERYGEIWNDYIDEFFKSVGYLPVYEFCRNVEKKYRIFRNFPGDTAFLMRLFELISENEVEYGNLRLFLDYYDRLDNDEILYVKSVESGNAVKLLTLHRSKGLEFHVVIIPFPSVNIGRHSGKIFSYDEKNAYIIKGNRDIIRLSDKARRIYEAEKKESLIDEVNLLYVGFTRAVDCLYIYLHEKSGSGKNVLYDIDFCGDYFSPVCKKDGAGADNSVFVDIRPSEYNFDFSVISDRSYDMDFGNKKLYGNIVHYLLSAINFSDYSENELERAREKCYALFSDKGMVDSAVEDVKTFLNSEEGQNLFFSSGNFEFYAEFSFVDDNGNMMRVDMLMVSNVEKEVRIIEYKTGVEKNRKYYVEQVERYEKNITSVFPDYGIKSYLIYI